jgi:hypothetical protein
MTMNPVQVVCDVVNAQPALDWHYFVVPVLLAFVAGMGLALALTAVDGVVVEWEDEP